MAVTCSPSSGSTIFRMSPTISLRSTTLRTKDANTVMPLAKLMNSKPGGKGTIDQDVTVSKKPCRSIDDQVD